MSFQLEVFSLSHRLKKTQAESQLHFTVYWINRAVQWAFSLRFFPFTSFKKGSSWKLTALHCLLNKQGSTVSLQLEVFFLSHRLKKTQAESQLHFTVYWINRAVQWAFSLRFFPFTSFKKGSSWKVIAFHCLLNKQSGTVSLQLEFFFLSHRLKIAQAESPLHFTVYWINSEVQWAFSLRFSSFHIA